MSLDASFSDLDEFLLYNFDKCQGGEFRYVNVDEKPTGKDEKNWLRLYNQYLERFGLGEDFDKYMTCKQQLIKLRCEFLLTGDKMLLNYINIEEVNLEKLDPSKTQGMTIDQCLVHVSKWLGQIVSKKKITVVEFKNLVEEYVRSGK